MTRRVLVDTGPLCAIIDDKDQHHEACVDQLHGLTTPMLTCWPVLTEAAWLLRTDAAGIQQLLRAPSANLLEIAELDALAAQWIAAFMDRYKDLPAQLADAALIYLADREGIDTIFTLDRRDFTVYRLGSGKRPIIIPDTR